MQLLHLKMIGMPTSSSVDVNDQEVHKVIYLTEVSPDGSFPEGPFFTLVEALYNQIGMLKVHHCQS